MPGSFVSHGLPLEKKKRAEIKEGEAVCAKHCITESFCHTVISLGIVLVTNKTQMV